MSIECNIRMFCVGLQFIDVQNNWNCNRKTTTKITLLVYTAMKQTCLRRSISAPLSYNVMATYDAVKNHVNNDIIIYIIALAVIQRPLPLRIHVPDYRASHVG